ncbi:MAG: sialidase family protein [Candidatus Poribacteria bacterium]|nr:sialidase family protein [Candidatus Poribacteria bacterium]
MLIHTRSIAKKVFEIWRSPERFTKNPDIIKLPSGRLMLIYCDTDSHWSQENQILMLLASDDAGNTWFKHREIAQHDIRKGDERLVTPRLSKLKDGRLVAIVDQDDNGHFHEDQPPGILAFWSEDDGDTWSEAQNTGITGFEPDRIMDLPDGQLGVASQVMRGETQEFANIFSRSDDGGQTWYEQATIAHNGYHRFCEGAIVILDGGKELACVMRENHSAGIPCFVAFSQDVGKTWSKSQMLPFAIHRPYAKQIPDGRVLVTGRHVNGGLGTYGWCGDLKAEAGQWSVGGPRQQFAAELTSDSLIIDNKPGHECRYTLLPPECSKSEVILEARMRVEGEKGKAAAFLSVSSLSPQGNLLQIAPDWIMLNRQTVDFRKPIDMTHERTVTIHHRRGLLEVRIDNKTLISGCVWRESQPLSDFFGDDPSKRTQFGQIGKTGRSFWKSISYSVKNPTLQNTEWRWEASNRLWPDNYQREHLIQIHANPPGQKARPDHGYSSWLMLDDDQILLVDYTNFGDDPGQAHLIGVYLDQEDIK